MSATRGASRPWIALKRLDTHDDCSASPRRVRIPAAAASEAVTQLLVAAFALNSCDLVLKLRNHRGALIPLNASVPDNSKHMPHLLEVTGLFQHVRPKAKSLPVMLINRSVQTRLQSVHRRIHRLEELLPQVKLQRHDKLNQEIECLDQKLKFLHKRMQVADSHRWQGVLTRAPLW